MSLYCKINEKLRTKWPFDIIVKINLWQVHEIKDCFLKSPYIPLETFQAYLCNWLLTKYLYIHLFFICIYSCIFSSGINNIKKHSGPSLWNSTPYQVHNPYYGGQNGFIERDILIKVVLSQSEGISSNLLLHCGQLVKQVHLYFFNICLYRIN